MLVRGPMTTGIASLSPDNPVGAVVRPPAEHGISGVPVTNVDGVLLGVVTEGDLSGPAAVVLTSRRCSPAMITPFAASRAW